MGVMNKKTLQLDRACNLQPAFKYTCLWPIGYKWTML